MRKPSGVTEGFPLRPCEGMSRTITRCTLLPNPGSNSPRASASKEAAVCANPGTINTVSPAGGPCRVSTAAEISAVPEAPRSTVNRISEATGGAAKVETGTKRQQSNATPTARRLVIKGSLDVVLCRALYRSVGYDATPLAL